MLFGVLRLVEKEVAPYSWWAGSSFSGSLTCQPDLDLGGRIHRTAGLGQQGGPKLGPRPKDLAGNLSWETRIREALEKAADSCGFPLSLLNQPKSGSLTCCRKPPERKVLIDLL